MLTSWLDNLFIPKWRHIRKRLGVEKGLAIIKQVFVALLSGRKRLNVLLLQLLRIKHELDMQYNKQFILITRDET